MGGFSKVPQTFDEEKRYREAMDKGMEPDEMGLDEAEEGSPIKEIEKLTKEF